MLKAFDNGNYTIFAENREEALSILCNDMGVTQKELQETDESDDFQELDLESEYTLQEERNGEFIKVKNAVIIEESDNFRVSKAKLKDWAEAIGKGVLGMEEY